MTYRLRPLASALFAMTAVAVAGCADPYAGRMEISGTVNLEGKPLKEGSIQFVPLDEKVGTQTGGPIANGEYKIPREGGLKPGKYLVRITSGDGKTPADEEAGNPGGSTNIVSFDRIPPDWNVNSKQEVVVKSPGPNQFDFAIPKANTPRPRR
jgi:hypothetical protein